MDPATDSPVIEGKKKFNLLPPNDPSRKDWGILSDSLGLQSHASPSPGATPEQAAEEMRLLLLRCVQSEKAYEALIMKCAGTSVGRKLQDGGDFAEMLSFLKSRLWNRRQDATKTVSTLGREFSSNDIIQAWNPIAGGIGKYLQVNVANILARDWTGERYELTNPARESLDRLHEAGLEPDTSGRMVDRSSAGFGDSDAPDYVESDNAFDKESEKFSATRQARVEGEGIESEEEIETLAQDDVAFEEDSRTPARQAFEASLLGSKHVPLGSPVLATTEHPDYRVLASALMRPVPEADLDRESRTDQLRALACETFELHFQDSEELPELLEATSSWEPNKYTFARFFPEALQSISQSLDQAGMERVTSPDLELAIAVDAVELKRDIEGLAEPKVRPKGMNQREWKELRESTRSWYSARAETQDDLLEPSRVDYLALCLLHNKIPNAEIEPDDMAGELKAMTSSWLGDALKQASQFGSETAQSYSQNFSVIAEMRQRLETWEPLRDGFLGEQMTQHIHEIRLEQEERDRVQMEAEVAKALASEEKTLSDRKGSSTRAKLPAFDQPMTLFDVADYSAPKGDAPKGKKATRRLPVPPAPEPSNVPQIQH